MVISGLNGALVGVRRSVPVGYPPPRLEPTYGYRVRVTSIIDFTRVSARAPVEARLRLINPRRRDRVEFDGQSLPLAANFSAPLLSYSHLNELWLGFIT